ncbi:D-2-hydroxyacid dehydrogenase [Sphingomonas sp. RS6]
MKAVLPALARPLLEPYLPAGLDIAWFVTPEDAVSMARDAAIGWLDINRPDQWARAVAAGERLQWLSTIYAGIDPLDTALLRARGTRVTNGSGVNAHAVAEYAVMACLIAAKRFDTVLRSADQRAWLSDTPGKVELFESRALVVGYGTIGRLIGARLRAFGVEVVTRSGGDGTLAPEQWRERIGDHDWVVLAAPATRATDRLIGEAELQMMKPGAWIINVGRGELIDQDALIEAVSRRRIGGAFLDTVTPEPLPADHPLWSTPNIILSMHLSGRSQTRMFQRSAALFLDNLRAFLVGEPLTNEVDLAAGY